MTRMPKPMVQAEVCGTCVHYHQHYVMLPSGRPLPLWYGHCTMPALKGRNPDQTCEHWEENYKDE